MRKAESSGGDFKLMNAHINCAVVATVLAVIGITSVLYTKPTFSQIEKRELARFPDFSYNSLMSGLYTRELSSYFADTFLARDGLVSLSSLLKQWSGIEFDQIRAHNATSPSGQAINPQQSQVTNTTESTAPLPENSVDGVVVPPQQTGDQAVKQDEEAVRKGAIYVYKGKGFQAFNGSDAVGKMYTDVINRYHDEIGEGVQIHTIIIPSPIEFGLPKKYKDITTPELPKIQTLYNNLNPDINAVNIYNILDRHKDEYLFFATDHHWTSLGAYYAYVEFCNSLNMTPVDITGLEKRTLYNFLGTLYAQTQDISMTNNPDYVDYYMMPGEYTVSQYRQGAPFTPYRVSLYGEYALPINSYSVFLHGDFPLTVIDTQNKNGRKIVVVKESYGNAFAPFLINNFEQVLVVDERYLEIGLIDLIKQFGATDLLFINNIFSCFSPYHINKIDKIMNQVYIPPVIEEEQPPQEQLTSAPSVDMPED